MQKKPRATEVITDKLWITYDIHGNKNGTMRPATDNPEQLIQYLSDGTSVAYDLADIKSQFDFEEKIISTWHQKYVLGYPISEGEFYKPQVKENLPAYTKSEDSKIYYAAGHYGINFPNTGWTASFCPKINTLRKYEYVGPFKTEADVSIVIQRKKRELS